MLTISLARSDATLPPFRADDLAQGLPDGAVPFLFDLFKDKEASHADAAYTDGQTLTDLSLTGDGSVVVAGGHTITSNATYGGANFSAVATDGNSVLKGPNDALAAIHAGAQHFMVVFYAVLPSAADWNDNSPIAPFFQSAAAGYISGPDMVTICQTAVGYLEARRQTNGGSTQTSILMEMASGNYGQLAQVAYWRNADETCLMLRTAADRQVETGPVGSDNSGDFSATEPQWGLSNGFWAAGSLAHQQDAANFTILRGWVENLEISKRNPRAVLDADWDRVAARVAAL